MALRKKLLDNTTELRAFLGYAFIVLRPGAEPPQHPQRRTTPATLAPDAWTDDEYRAYVDEARRDMDGQQAAISDIRSRAQIVLTTSLIIAAAIVGSFDGKGDACAVGKVLYLLAGVLTGLTALAAGGIITAKSTVGAPNLEALLDMETGLLHKRMADEYAATRHQGAATVAMLVTVLRYCVLVMLLGAGMLGAAYVWV